MAHLVAVLYPGLVLCLVAACGSATNGASVAAITFTSSSDAVWNEFSTQLQSDEYKAQIGTLAQSSWRDLFEQTKDALIDDAFVVDGFEFRNVRSDFLAAEPQFIAMDNIYPSVGDFWDAIAFDPFGATTTSEHDNVATVGSGQAKGVYLCGPGNPPPPPGGPGSYRQKAPAGGSKSGTSSGISKGSGSKTSASTGGSKPSASASSGKGSASSPTPASSSPAPSATPARSITPTAPASSGGGSIASSGSSTAGAGTTTSGGVIVPPVTSQGKPNQPCRSKAPSASTCAAQNIGAASILAQVAAATSGGYAIGNNPATGKPYQYCSGGDTKWFDPHSQSWSWNSNLRTSCISQTYQGSNYPQTSSTSSTSGSGAHGYTIALNPVTNKPYQYCSGGTTSWFDPSSQSWGWNAKSRTSCIYQTYQGANYPQN